MHALTTCLLLTAVTVPVVANAQPGPENTLMVGAGAIASPRYAGARAIEVKPVPFIILRREVAPSHHVYIAGPGGGYEYEVNNQLRVGLHGQYKFERETDEDLELRGMPKVKGAVEVGPRVRYQVSERTGLEARVLTDIADGHQGTTARLGAEHTLPVAEKTRVRLSSGINYGSEDYVRAYYGVPATAVAAGRPAYRPEGGLTHIDADVQVTQRLMGNWSAQAGLGADILTADAADSPLTKSPIQPRALLGILYKF